jgi:serine/threonine protein kinase
MLSGKSPFSSNDFDDILHARYSMEDLRWKTVSYSAKKLIKNLMQKNVEDRMTIEAVLADEWLSGVEVPIADNLIRVKQAPAKKPRPEPIVISLVDDEEEEEEQSKQSKKPVLKKKRSRSEATKVVAEPVVQEKEEEEEVKKSKVEASHTREELEKLRVVDLKKLLKDKGLSVVGKKALLVDRLLE